MIDDFRELDREEYSTMSVLGIQSRMRDLHAAGRLIYILEGDQSSDFYQFCKARIDNVNYFHKLPLFRRDIQVIFDATYKEEEHGEGLFHFIEIACAFLGIKAILHWYRADIPADDNTKLRCTIRPL